MEKKNKHNPEDQVGEILRAGLKSQSKRDEDFVSGVMHRIDELDSVTVFPPFLWAVPAALVACLAVSLVWNFQAPAEAESSDLEEMLLIDMPAETQSLLARSPSATTVLWSNAQGGLLP